MGGDMVGGRGESLVNEPIESRAIAWLLTAETGLSSVCLCATMLGHPSHFGLSGTNRAHPMDPSDFRRCYRLLQIFPEWRDRIGEMAAVSPEWAALVSEWDELERLYEEERLSAAFPKLFGRIDELVRSARRTD